VEGLGKDFSNATDILLTQGDTLRMGEYYVSYTGKERKGHNIIYHIQYFSKDSATHKYLPQFTLTPVIQLNPQMGNVRIPSTRHFFTKDIFTDIAFVPPNTLGDENQGGEMIAPKSHMLKPGDTMFSSNSIIVLAALDSHVDKVKYHLKSSDFAVGAILKVVDINDKKYTVEPIYVISNNAVQPIDATIPELGLKFTFPKVDPDAHLVEIGVSEFKPTGKEFVVMEAFIFPYINVLWMGCIIMIIGTVLSIRQRIRKNREAKAAAPANE
jgi:cytochrome c-type biogenesis protein CcmF